MHKFATGVVLPPQVPQAPAVPNSSATPPGLHATRAPALHAPSPIPPSAPVAQAKQPKLPKVKAPKPVRPGGVKLSFNGEIDHMDSLKVAYISGVQRALMEVGMLHYPSEGMRLKHANVFPEVAEAEAAMAPPIQGPPSEHEALLQILAILQEMQQAEGMPMGPEGAMPPEGMPMGPEGMPPEGMPMGPEGMPPEAAMGMPPEGPQGPPQAAPPKAPAKGEANAEASQDQEEDKSESSKKEAGAGDMIRGVGNMLRGAGSVAGKRVGDAAVGAGRAMGNNMGKTLAVAGGLGAAAGVTKKVVDNNREKEKNSPMGKIKRYAKNVVG